MKEINKHFDGTNNKINKTTANYIRRMSTKSPRKRNNNLMNIIGTPKEVIERKKYLWMMSDKERSDYYMTVFYKDFDFDPFAQKLGHILPMWGKLRRIKMKMSLLTNFRR